MFIVKNINAFVKKIIVSKEKNQIPKTYNYGYQPELLQIKCNFKEILDENEYIIENSLSYNMIFS